MATRTALLLTAIVCAVGLLGLFAAAILVFLDRPDPLLHWLAGVGAFAAIVGAAGIFDLLRRHFRELDRLRSTVANLAGPSSPLTDIDQIRQAIGLFQSQAEEIQARPDQRLAAILGSIDQAIVVVTASGQVSLVNDAVQQRLGTERVAVGTSLFAALSRRAVEAAAAASRAAGRPVDAELYTVESAPLAAKVCDLGEHGGTVITFSAAESGRSAVAHDMPPAAAPATEATPLSDLPAFVFDCETTGLDVKSDRIVALGGVRMHGPQIFRGVTIDRLVDPGQAIPARSTRIHGIDDSMVADAGTMGSHWPDLDALMQDTVIVGHNIAFDIAHLRWAAKRAGIAWSPPRSLDTLLLVAALEPSAAGFDLEAVADRYGVNIRGRHTALGDSLVTAEIFARLIPHLAARGVHTLGDAIAFGQRAKAFINRQRDSGWYDAPAD